MRRKRRRQPLRKQSKRTKKEEDFRYFCIAWHPYQSCECAKTELDVFSVPPTQTSSEYGNYVEYHPLSSITDSGPIEFDVSSSGQNYLDFANTQLLAKLRLLEATGTTLPTRITWEESTCFCIAYSSKSTSR